MCWNEQIGMESLMPLWSNKAISASLPRLLVIWDVHMTHNEIYVPYFLLFIDFYCIIFLKFTAIFIIVDVS